MLITKKFVIINFPKTGSTFVRETLKKIHSDIDNNDRFFSFIKKKNNLLNLWLPNIRADKLRYGVEDEHGLCCQIPKEHSYKKIVSVKRDLFERYISVFEYGDWKVSPWLDEKVILNKFKNYPNLSFKEFIQLMLEFNPWELHPKVNRKLPIGAASSQFIAFYFKKPFEILSKIDENYLSSSSFKSDMFDVHFLNQSNLNDDLYNFLLSNGYKKNDLKDVKTAKKINNSTPEDKSISDYFDESLKNRVKEKEKLLFKIFDKYEV